MPSRPRPRRAAVTVAGGLLALFSAGCGGELSADEQRQRLAEDLVTETDGALDDERARCVADALHEQYGDDSFQRVLDAAARPQTTTDANADVRSEVIDIFASCDALDPIIDQG